MPALSSALRHSSCRSVSPLRAALASACAGPHAGKGHRLHRKGAAHAQAGFIHLRAVNERLMLRAARNRIVHLALHGQARGVKRRQRRVQRVWPRERRFKRHFPFLQAIRCHLCGRERLPLARALRHFKRCGGRMLAQRSVERRQRLLNRRVHTLVDGINFRIVGDGLERDVRHRAVEKAAFQPLVRIFECGRPHFSATNAVVPLPQVGSSTSSPGSVVIRRQRSMALDDV